LNDAIALPTHCRNCDSALGDPPPHYCPQCGQGTTPHPPSLMEFAHEFVGHYVAFEGKLWRTLGKLFFVPGELTREYLRGRKLRYVLPLRLYLTASFLFFVLVKLLGGDTNLITTTVDGQPVAPTKALVQLEKQLATQKATVPADSDDAKALDEVAKTAANLRAFTEARKQGGVPAGNTILKPCDSGSAACQKINQRLQERFKDMTTAQVIEQVKSRAGAKAPYVVFLLLPFYAGMMKLAYLGRRMYYGEHLVFALHLHAFLFFLMLVESMVPVAVKPILMSLGMVYGGIAMQRVYGGRWWATVLRYGVVGISYLILIMIVALAVFIGAVFY